MQISKQQVLEHLRGHGHDEQVEQADKLLPDTIDTDEHAAQLQKLGVDPGKLMGGFGDKLGL